MRTPGSALARMPLLPRFVLIGVGCAGLVGAVVGLVVGLNAYAPTAPFAVIELGLPATVAGAVSGLAIASLVLMFRWVGKRRGS